MNGRVLKFFPLRRGLVSKKTHAECVHDFLNKELRDVDSNPMQV